MNNILLLPNLSATRVSSNDSKTSPSKVNVMKIPILESGNLSEEKKRARISEGMPAVNIRNDRRVMMMYASRPVALSEVKPRNPAIRDMAVGAMVAMLDCVACWGSAGELRIKYCSKMQTRDQLLVDVKKKR
jgi:hypothetical protein